MFPDLEAAGCQPERTGLGDLLMQARQHQCGQAATRPGLLLLQGVWCGGLCQESVLLEKVLVA